MRTLILIVSRFITFTHVMFRNPRYKLCPAPRVRRRWRTSTWRPVEVGRKRTFDLWGSIGKLSFDYNMSLTVTAVLS